eukprot:1198788-Amphidinium_carterae.1
MVWLDVHGREEALSIALPLTNATTLGYCPSMEPMESLPRHRISTATYEECAEEFVYGRATNLRTELPKLLSTSTSSPSSCQHNAHQHYDNMKVGMAFSAVVALAM